MPVQTIESQLQTLFDDVGDDFDKAEPVLAKRPSLRQHLLRLGWEEAVATARRNERTILKQTPVIETALIQSRPDESATRRLVTPTDTPRAPRAISSFSRQVIGDAMNRLLTNFTVNGVPLGECTRDRLLADAERQVQLGEGCYRNADFDRRLAEMLTDKETVAQLAAGRPADVEAARVAAFGARGMTRAA